MSEHATTRRAVLRAGARRAFASLAVTLLAVEFLDELTFGGREAFWPLIRDDLGLSYAEIGLLLTLPRLFGNAVEPALGILSDVWDRRAIVLGGGVAFAAAAALSGASPGFWTLMAAFALFNPASGAFVGLSQATLMDLEPERREQNMARWCFAGSAALAAAPLVAGALMWAGAGWRELFFGASVVAALLVARVWRFRFPRAAESEQAAPASFREGLRDALNALRRREVVRWLLLLQCSDLMLDTLHAFLALYFVDVAGASPAEAALAVAVWSGVGLAGDALLIPLLERVDGIRYLRASAAVMAVVFAGFLVAPGLVPKLALLGLAGMLNSGWYSVLQARLYGAMPGRSGAVLALSNAGDVVGALVPVALGALASAAGLEPVMWLLLAGPVALLAGLPRAGARRA